MKRVAFRDPPGTMLPGSGGLVNMARLRTLPADQKKEMIRRLQVRRYRQRLAEITVAQWKWFARKGLSRIQKERQQGRLVIASACYRRSILSKLFDAMVHYKNDRIQRREVHLAHTFFKRRFFHSWRNEFSAARASTLRTFFTQFKVLLFIRRRRLKSLCRTFHAIKSFSLLHKSAVIFYQRLLLRRWATYTSNQIEDLSKYSSAVLFQKQRRVFLNWRATTAAAKHYSTATLRRGLSAWKVALELKHFATLRMIFARWALLPVAATLRRRVIQKLFLNWKMSLLRNRTQRRTRRSCLTTLRQFTVVRKIIRGREQSVRRLVLYKLTRQTTASRMCCRINRTMLVTRFHTWRQFVVKKTSERSTHLRLHLARIRHTIPHSLRRKSRPSPRGLPTGLASDQISEQLSKPPSRIPLKQISVPEQRVPTFKTRGVAVQLVSKEAPRRSSINSSIQLMALKSSDGVGSVSTHSVSEDMSSEVEVKTRCESVAAPCLREIATQCDISAAKDVLLSSSESDSLRNEIAIQCNSTSYLPTDSLLKSEDITEVPSAERESEGQAANSSNQKSTLTSQEGGIQLLRSLVTELISEQLPSGGSRQGEETKQKGVQIWNNTPIENVNPHNRYANGVSKINYPSRRPSCGVTSASLRPADRIQPAMAGVELLPSSSCGSRQSPNCLIDSFPNSPTSDPSAHVFLQPLGHRLTSFQSPLNSSSHSEVRNQLTSEAVPHSPALQSSANMLPVDVPTVPMVHSSESSPTVQASPLLKSSLETCEPTYESVPSTNHVSSERSVRRYSLEGPPTGRFNSSEGITNCGTTAKNPLEQQTAAIDLKYKIQKSKSSVGSNREEELNSDDSFSSPVGVGDDLEVCDHSGRVVKPTDCDEHIDIGMEMFAVASAFADSKRQLLSLRHSNDERSTCEKQHAVLRTRLLQLREQIKVTNGVIQSADVLLK